MRPEELATAHDAWDQRWASEGERSRWIEPVPLVVGLVPLLESRARVLDLGCGIGRHAHFLASNGFTCVGIDGSEVGLTFARSRAASDGVSVLYRSGVFYDLGDFEAASFEAVVAWNVIYHGDHDVVQRAEDEIARVLVPGGLLVGSLLSKRNANYGRGREVRPDTFVIDDADDDKVHPHFYCDARGLLDLHRQFEPLELRDREQTPGAFHWEYLLERARPYPSALYGGPA